MDLLLLLYRDAAIMYRIAMPDWIEHVSKIQGQFKHDYQIFMHKSLTCTISSISFACSSFKETCSPYIVRRASAENMVRPQEKELLLFVFLAVDSSMCTENKRIHRKRIISR